MSTLERTSSSPLAEMARTEDSDGNSILDYDPLNSSPLSMKTRDDNYVTNVLQKRAFSQPNIHNFSPRKGPTGSSRLGRRTATFGNYDLSPQDSGTSLDLKNKSNIVYENGTIHDLESAFDDFNFSNDMKKYLDIADFQLEKNATSLNKSYLHPLRNADNANSSATFAGYDMEYPRQVDKIPSVKPNVNYQDKLWTQIDVLDDVKKMSEEAIRNKSFFTPKYEESLRSLKKSQISLLNSVKKMEKKVDTYFHKKIWFEFDIDLDKVEDLRYLYNKEHFDLVRSSIDDVRKELNGVSKLMELEGLENETSESDSRDEKKDLIEEQNEDQNGSNERAPKGSSRRHLSSSSTVLRA